MERSPLGLHWCRRLLKTDAWLLSALTWFCQTKLNMYIFAFSIISYGLFPKKTVRINRPSPASGFRVGLSSSE